MFNISIVNNSDKLDPMVRDLQVAVIRNDALMVKYFLSQGADPNGVEEQYKRNSLHFAAYTNVGESHFEVAEILLKCGADVNAKDRDGVTPIFYLVMKGNAKITQLFLNFNADLDVKDRHGRNLMASAVSMNNKADYVQYLINLGVDSNHLDDSGSEPLQYACKVNFDNLKILKCLLKNGSHINAANNGGSTPLIQELMKYGKFIGYNEMMKKKLIFVVEHTDFNVIHEGINFFIFRSLPRDAWMIMLEHLVVLQILEIPVQQVLLETIQKFMFGEYYEKCRKELLRAKNIRLKNSWITFFDLLVDGRKKLKNYAGNGYMVKDFKSYDCVAEFPIYGAAMTKNVEKGIKRRVLYNTSANFLSNCLPIFSPTHLIIRDTLDCLLSKKDLSKFCELN